MISVIVGTLSLLWAALPPVLAQQVTCHSTIKLRNKGTQFYLHSQEIPYGSGSGQQSVTGLPDGDDAGSYWEIFDAKKSTCEQLSPIQKNQVIRLSHMETGKWLHSHLHESPLSKNQEVSGFGAPGKSDTGDFWKVTWDGSLPTWTRDMKVFFQHVDTGTWLGDTGRSYNRPIAGQHEVACKRSKDSASAWQAAEGMYLHPPESAENVSISDEL